MDLQPFLPLAQSGSTLPRFGQDLLHILLFTAVSLVIFAISIRIIDWGTPGRLLKVILEEKNMALGIYLAGALIGLGIVMQGILSSPTDVEYGAIHFTDNVDVDAVLNTILWGLLAPIVQILAMRIFDLITPGIDFRKALADDNRAMGIVLGALNIAIGFVMAALFAG